MWLGAGKLGRKKKMANRKNRRTWGAIRKQGTKSGHYQASYVHNAIRWFAPNTFANKLNAESWLIKERELIEAGTWTSPEERRIAARVSGPTLTVATYGQQWIDIRPLKARTRIEYQSLFDRLIVRRGAFEVNCS